jgi:ABC-type transporter Mla subunit MlaD
MKQIAATLQTLGERFQGLISAAEESQQRSRGMIDSAAQNVLDALVSGAGAVTSNLKTSIEDLATTLRGASQDLSSQFAGAGSEIQASGQATAERIAGALGGFNESVIRLERVSTTQHELATRIQELTVGLQGAGGVVLEAHRGFQESLEPTRAIARSLDSASARLADSLSATSRIVDEAAMIGKVIQAEHEKISSVWQAYETRFLGVEQALQVAFRQLEEGVGRYTEQIRAFHVDADKYMGQSVQTLASATKELSEAVEEIGERLPRERS